MYIDNKLMLTGYAKCPPDFASQLLMRGGDRGIFVEPLSCDNANRKPVVWIPRLDEEEPLAYFRRVLTTRKAKTFQWFAEGAMAAAGAFEEVMYPYNKPPSGHCGVSRDHGHLR